MMHVVAWGSSSIMSSRSLHLYANLPLSSPFRSPPSDIKRHIRQRPTPLTPQYEAWWRNTWMTPKLLEFYNKPYKFYTKWMQLYGSVTSNPPQNSIKFRCIPSSCKSWFLWFRAPICLSRQSLWPSVVDFPPALSRERTAYFCARTPHWFHFVLCNLLPCHRAWPPAGSVLWCNYSALKSFRTYGRCKSSR